MVFTSPVFLYFFLPAALIAFYLFPARWRTAPLLLASAIFYAWGEPVLVVLILATGVFTYYWGKLLGPDQGHRKGVLTVGIVVCLVPITVFKYLDFALTSIGLAGLAERTHLPLPIGVSFYTFMAISYLVDIYRRTDDGAPNLLAFSGFLAMYPHLVAGPIVRWAHIGPQLAAPRFNPGLFGYGALRVASGLAKKAVLADSLAAVVDDLFATGPQSFAGAWLAVVLYSLQIYLDFSAYSDIAIGLAAMMGVRFHENFRFPYLARSAREFWQRWHISLGSWFRDYLYIPLGGSRVSQVKLWRNLVLVWALTGLWHGAALTFILWGIYFGLVIGLERTVYGAALARLPQPVQHVYGLLVAVFGWVFFRSVDVHQAIDYFAAMFGFGAGPLLDGQAQFAFQRSWVAALIAVVLAAGAARRFMDWVEGQLTQHSAERPIEAPLDAATRPLGIPDTGAGPEVHGAAARAGGVDVLTVAGHAPEPSPYVSVGVSILVLLLLAIASGYMVATTYSPFIYFRF